MTSTQIRQSFLDFFKSKQHTIVPSSSLMPDSPNLLFTNAGMNQFVPIFLGQTQCPYTPGRAADTQKCIRAGGKHNDLDDVGLDTYHHTFFEMLGNWSFGDYFKKEAIEWAWELVVNVWKFPPQRLYATIYNPDISQGDPAERDEEAWNYWAEKFRSVGLDPAVHIVNGNKKDNFWMMGETGPCGPCSELHVDLTPAGNTKGSLVNKGDARCIEIWNLVFIQFNANPDGTFSPLPAKHVDTGMGFERVTSIIQGTKGMTDFANAKISNYETDIFRPIFDALEKLSGKKYTSTLPNAAPAPAEPVKTSGEAPSDIIDIDDSRDVPAPPASKHRKAPNDVSQQPSAEQIAIDIAFRVIADHIRTLSFAIADGIIPGNTDRNYVLRRILRRAVRYGRTLGFHEPFFYKLVDVLAETMGKVFPEIRAKKKHVQEVIRTEEEAFNKTLDRGIMMFEEVADLLEPAVDLVQIPNSNRAVAVPISKEIGAEFAFQLYDTYGFPLDLTELMARERGLTVDKEGFEKLMEEQRNRARAAQKKEVISLSQIETTTPTKFVGFDQEVADIRVLEVVSLKDKTAVILDASVCYAEMGGQVGDTGILTVNDKEGFVAGAWDIVNTQKSGNTWLHFIEERADAQSRSMPEVGQNGMVVVSGHRRKAIERHHTVTHLLHFALHEVVSKEVSQKGSFVGPDKLTFDFNSAPLIAEQIADIERLVNERILENAPVSWTEVPYADVKSRKDVMQFFGDKYGDTVRVVSVGDFSIEFCGGTHTTASGEVGPLVVLGEASIGSNIRRVEALTGEAAYRHLVEVRNSLDAAGSLLRAPSAEVPTRIEGLLSKVGELEDEIEAIRAQRRSDLAVELVGEAVEVGSHRCVVAGVGEMPPEQLRQLALGVRERLGSGAVVLGSTSNGKGALVGVLSRDLVESGISAAELIAPAARELGGGGSRDPELAQAGGPNGAALVKAIDVARDEVGRALA